MDASTRTSNKIFERNYPQLTFRIVGIPKFWLAKVWLSRLSTLLTQEVRKLGNKLENATSIQWSVYSCFLFYHCEIFSVKEGGGCVRTVWRFSLRFNVKSANHEDNLLCVLAGARRRQDSCVSSFFNQLTHDPSQHYIVPRMFWSPPAPFHHLLGSPNLPQLCIRIWFEKGERELKTCNDI